MCLADYTSKRTEHAEWQLQVHPSRLAQQETRCVVSMQNKRTCGLDG